MNGNATVMACTEILNRLLDFAKLELKVELNDKIKIVDEVIYINNLPTEMKWND